MFVLLYATNIYFCKEIKNDIDQKMMNSMKTPQEIAEMISKRFYPLANVCKIRENKNKENPCNY